jgi:anti-sigma regulatory factor (Ser/Thr protein kinase)
VTFAVDISRDHQAPAAARHAVDRLAGRLDQDLVPTVKLLVSELVTNAVKYGGGREIRLELESDRPSKVRAEVIDQGLGFIPVARDRPANRGRRLGPTPRADALQPLGRARGLDARLVRDRALKRGRPA